jgi:hypothetical protein
MVFLKINNFLLCSAVAVPELQAWMQPVPVNASSMQHSGTAVVASVASRNSKTTAFLCSGTCPFSSLFCSAVLLLHAA